MITVPSCVCPKSSLILSLRKKRLKIFDYECRLYFSTYLLFGGVIELLNYYFEMKTKQKITESLIR